MFSTTYFQDPTIVDGTTTEGGGTIDPLEIQTIVNNMALSATTLKDTRTTPVSELPPAKYARVYEGSNPGTDYMDTVFAAFNAEHANSLGGYTASNFAKQYLALGDPQDVVYRAVNCENAGTALVAENANNLGALAANTYARKYVEGPEAHQDTVYRATTADFAMIAGATSNVNTLGGVPATEYARKADGSPSTEHTVYNAQRVGLIEADKLALKYDPAEYNTTLTTVYNALNLGNLAAADYLNIAEHIRYFGNGNRDWIDLIASQGDEFPQTALTSGQGDYAKYIYVYNGDFSGHVVRLRHSSWFPTLQRNKVELCIFNNSGNTMGLYMPYNVSPAEAVNGLNIYANGNNSYFNVPSKHTIYVKYRPPTPAGGSGGNWVRISPT